MTQRRGRRVDGIVLLDKPPGMTSNQALQRVKRLLQARKAGHTGALDPLATGMLPICLGEATKISAFLLEARKRYRVVARLGQATDTADADGKVLREEPVPELAADRLEPVLEAFRGEIQQVPPMYSALKHQGRRLYALARSGEVVPRPPRRVRIDELRLRRHDEQSLELELTCSKGTYVRTLVEDLAGALGTLGHVASLHRLSVEPFDGQPMATLEALQGLELEERMARWLLPMDSALGNLPSLRLDAEQARRLSHGQAVEVPAAQLPDGPLRLYRPEGRLLGLGEQTAPGRVAPKRLFVETECAPEPAGQAPFRIDWA